MPNPLPVLRQIGTALTTAREVATQIKEVANAPQTQRMLKTANDLVGLARRQLAGGPQGARPRAGLPGEAVPRPQIAPAGTRPTAKPNGARPMPAPNSSLASHGPRPNRPVPPIPAGSSPSRPLPAIAHGKITTALRIQQAIAAHEAKKSAAENAVDPASASPTTPSGSTPSHPPVPQMTTAARLKLAIETHEAKKAAQAEARPEHQIDAHAPAQQTEASTQTEEHHADAPHTDEPEKPASDGVKIMEAQRMMGELQLAQTIAQLRMKGSEAAVQLTK